MTDAYKCNGCGELKEGTPDGTVKTTLVLGEIELCLTCAREFKARYNND